MSLYGLHKMESTPVSLRSRISGSLLGGAIGDALGAPVEFLSLAAIKAAFGPNGIIEYAPAYGRIGAITDDTQMTLFTAEGLLRAYVRAQAKGIGSTTSVVSHAYMRWLLTQGIEPANKQLKISKDGWLWNEKVLHSSRAPGNTCVSALNAMTHFTTDRAKNNSKGAGGIMRVAPVAMMFAGQRDKTGKVFQLGMETAWLTHGHPSGYLSAAAFAVILHSLLCGETLIAGIDAACKSLAAQPDSNETVCAINLALNLAANKLDPEKALLNIGDGWVGEEALGIAIYCASLASDFSGGIRTAVNIDGDSDTTGSLVGQLLGAKHGMEGIPEHWFDALEARETITQIANDLCDHHDWKLGYVDNNYDYAITERYPGY